MHNFKVGDRIVIRSIGYGGKFDGKITEIEKITSSDLYPIQVRLREGTTPAVFRPEECALYKDNKIKLGGKITL